MQLKRNIIFVHINNSIIYNIYGSHCKLSNLLIKRVVIINNLIINKEVGSIVIITILIRNNKSINYVMVEYYSSN